jgi:hypothetical protein
LGKTQTLAGVKFDLSREGWGDHPGRRRHTREVGLM